MKDRIERMRQRTKEFALRIVRMYDALPSGRSAQAMGYQAFRAGTSVAAQYREACRARSNAEIVSKLESVLQELDETAFWLQLLVESKAVTEKELGALLEETDELTAMFVTAVKNIKQRH